VVYSIRSYELASIAKMAIPIRAIAVTIMVSATTSPCIGDLVHIVEKSDCNCILVRSSDHS